MQSSSATPKACHRACFSSTNSRAFPAGHAPRRFSRPLARARQFLGGANGGSLLASTPGSFLPSAEELADAHYPTGARIRLVLDNHSAHISKETRTFLGTLPNRFEFTFTPKHASWLNLIESLFGKMVKTLLRGIRAASADELKARIELHLNEVNDRPVVFRWKYKLETLPVV